MLRQIIKSKIYTSLTQFTRNLPKFNQGCRQISSLKKINFYETFIIPTSLVIYSGFRVAAAIPKSIMSEEQTLESLLQNADQLFDENHFQENFDLLSKHPDQSVAEIQWRKARALFSVSKAVKDTNEKAKLIRESFELAKSALESDDNNFAIHKWYSIILDACAELDGIKSRITQLENVKKHMLKAVELNPNDPTSWYILGVFEYNLADLPWIQRKIVSTIFASPPTGTYEQALEYFEKAEKLKEGFYTMNWLMLGKCNIALKNNDVAKGFIEKAANCPVLNEDDKNCKEEACKLMKKF